MKKRTIDEWKSILVGNTFGWLTVLDVYSDNGIVCKCQCKCGNIKIAPARKVYSGHTKSCGCYVKSAEHSRQMSDIINKPDVLAKLSHNIKQWCKEHPDEVKARTAKRCETIKNNPNILIEAGNKISQWCKDNPDKVAERTKKYLKWCSENKETLKELGKLYSEYCKNNPEKLKEIGARHSQWYKDNCEAAALIGNKISEWYKNNPDKVKKRVERQKETYYSNYDINISILKNSHRDKRINSVEDIDLSIVHPDDIKLLLNGENSHSLIRTMCPMCGEYSLHTAYNIINYRDNKIRNNALCRKCASNYTSSSQEQEICNYISSIYDGECIRNSRSIISPQELDLYYPEKKIAVEYNGAYFHSSQHDCDDSYHYNKFNKCFDKNIRLISIFEQDWYLRRDFILNLLNSIFISKSKFDINNCICSMITDINEPHKFILYNQLNYYADFNNCTYYGMYCNNVLFLLMLIRQISAVEYEIVDFISDKQIYISPDHYKLVFNTFINKHNPSIVLAHSDNDFYKGDIFRNLNFKLISTSPHIQLYNKKECVEITDIDDISDYSNYFKICRCGVSNYMWTS